MGPALCALRFCGLDEMLEGGDVFGELFLGGLFVGKVLHRQRSVAADLQKMFICAKSTKSERKFGRFPRSLIVLNMVK